MRGTVPHTKSLQAVAPSGQEKCEAAAKNVFRTFRTSQKQVRKHPKTRQNGRFKVRRAGTANGEKVQ